MTEVRLDPRTLRRVARSRGVQAACLRVAAEVAAEVRRLAPVATGEFRSSIGVYPRDEVGARVLSTDPAGLFIEYGTEDTPRFRVFGRAAADHRQ